MSKPLSPRSAGGFPGYHVAFDRLEGPISRLLQLSQVQESLLSLIGDLREESVLKGDRKAAIEFIASEIRTEAGALEDLWLEFHNAAPDASSTGGAP